LSLTYQGEMVGNLLLAPRTAGEGFSPADRRLLTVLAQQAGVAAHTVQLTTDLQQSRERLIMAREEERRRLRRDLHDGVGPTLASMAQRIDAATYIVRDNPDEAIALLQGLKGQVRSTLADIRRLVYALRPQRWMSWDCWRPSANTRPRLRVAVTSRCWWRRRRRCRRCRPPSSLRPTALRWKH